MEEPPASWRSRLKRWRWWIAAVAFIVAVRVALPIVLRHVVAAQASEALHARVDVGDVDLALWKGGVALDDVAVYSAVDSDSGGISAGTSGGGRRASGVRETHPPVTPDQSGETNARPTPPAPGADGAAPSSESPVASADPPIVAFKRFAVEVRYVPLFSQTIQLRDVALDSPRLALDRLASGDLNVMALVPTSEVAVEAGATPGAGADASPTPAAAADDAASAWKFGLDRFVLRDGRLRFRDLKLAGSEPVEVGIDEVAVQEIALSPGVYGEPAQLNVKLGLEGGVIDVAAQLQLLDQGMAVTCTLNAQRLPLRHARLYVPKVGWSELQGELDLALTYTLQTETKNEVRGTIALRDIAVTVPQLEDVAVAWKSLGVEIETVDLIAQRAALASVALDGAKFYVRAGGDQPFPVLAALTAPAADEAAPEPAPTPAQEAKEEESPAEPEEPAKPWDWSVASVRVTNSIVHVLSDQPPLDVGVDLTAANLASAADAIAHVALALGLGPAAVKVDGNLRIAAPAFGGTLQIADLALPPLVAVSGAVEPSVLPSATFKADLAVEAGLAAKEGGAALPDVLRVSGGLGLSDTRLSPPGQPDLTVEAKALDLTISELTVPGVIPVGQKAEPGAALRLAAELKLVEPHVVRSGEQPLDVSAQAIGLAVSELSLPAALAGLATSDVAQPIRAVARLDLTEPRVALAGAELSAQAQTISLAVSEAAITAVPPGAAAAAAPPARVVAQLDLSEPKVAIAEGKQLAAGAQAIGLEVSELTLPGLTAGAPPSDTGAPLHAVTTLTLAQPRAVRGDGKEFSFAARSVAVPVTDLSVSGALAPAEGTAPSVRASFGEVRIDAPVARLTRTKEGIVLPGAAAPAAARVPAGTAGPAVAQSAPPPPAAPPSPAAGGQPLEVTVAALRLTKGDVDFTDRAVQPAFHDRYAPIEIDARNLRFPSPAVKPLRLEVVSAAQGHITATGEFGPQGGAFEMVMDKWSLAPLNPYATTYSPYGIGDGALTIKTTAKFRGGKYDVTNALTLHQLDLTGAEGDSLFEQQFGVPLTMVLALLRDTSGDIDLSIPVEVDQSGGATVDLVGIVRSALRQALMGAIQSPLKLVGGVIGTGGKGSIAPAPIAFALGRAEPTEAGAEAAQRLADFLTGRPGMAVQLETGVTAGDARWLHEQALRGEWQEEGFFQRSVAFVTQRGPRERIGSYLAARAEGDKPELSAEDAATLQQWLDERPPPTPEQLDGLAAARLAAVESVLEQKGIDAARLARGEPGDAPAEGAPVVRIKFRPLSQAPAAPSTSTQEE